MRYVLGVEGGQTSTTAVVADETGCLLGIGYGGPANHLREPGGVERAQQALRDAIRGAVTMADLENARISAACLGLAGGAQAVEQVYAPVVPAEHLLHGSDTRIALYSVTFGRRGAVVIAGTGSAAFGTDGAGKQASAGGWGHLLGDEGSGYWIGLRALNACCRAQDGIAPPTQMLSAILQNLETTDLAALQQRVYSGQMDRQALAALSEVVSRAAAQGDPTAVRILREAGRELAQAVNAVLLKLGLDRGPVCVGTVGGVFRSGRLVLRTFRKGVMRVAPEAAIQPARVPAAVGAALLALEEIGQSAHTSLLANLEASLARIGPGKA